MKQILVILIIATAFAVPYVQGAGKCSGTPTLPAGSKWVPSNNCTKGPTYNEGTAFHCHCWCHKGYICDPKATSATTKKAVKTTTTKAPTTPVATKEPCPGRVPPVPAGSTWVASPGCPVGPTYNNPGNGGPPMHCHCWCHKGYICDPKKASSTTSATTAATSDSTTAATSDSTTAATSDSTTAATSDSTTAATSDSTTAASSDSTTAATSDSTTAATSDSTTAATSDSTTAASSDSTTAASSDSTTAASSDSTTAAASTAASSSAAP